MIIRIIYSKLPETAILITQTEKELLFVIDKERFNRLLPHEQSEVLAHEMRHVLYLYELRNVK
jgi:predicted metallopeptidase